MTRFRFLLIFSAVGLLAPYAARAADDVPATIITSDKSEVWSNDGTEGETYGYFEGNVVVSGNNLKITCDRLDITASRIGDKTITVGNLEKFKYLLAVGKVRITQGDREASCGRAEVFPREDKVVLTENPVVIDHGGPATWVGTKLVLLRGERRVQGENVKITFPPIKDLGFDKNQVAPKPETPPAPASPASTPPAITPTAPTKPTSPK
jgi:lipopolysaccharide export system protein LptA